MNDLAEACRVHFTHHCKPKVDVTLLAELLRGCVGGSQLYQPSLLTPQKDLWQQ